MGWEGLNFCLTRFIHWLPAHGDTRINGSIVPDSRRIRHRLRLHLTSGLLDWSCHGPGTEVKVDLILVKRYRRLGQVVWRRSSVMTLSVTCHVSTRGVMMNNHNGSTIYLTSRRSRLTPRLGSPVTVLHGGHRVVDVTVDSGGLTDVVPLSLDPPLDGVVGLAGVALLASLPAEAAQAGLVADTWHRRQGLD